MPDEISDLTLLQNSDDRFMREALRQARRALAADEVPIGPVELSAAGVTCWAASGMTAPARRSRASMRIFGERIGAQFRSRMSFCKPFKEGTGAVPLFARMAFRA